MIEGSLESRIASVDRTSYIRQLNEIADELLTQGNHQELRAAAGRLYELLSYLTGVDAASANPADLVDRVLPNGKAISPNDAARCVFDFMRTHKFLKGVHQAVLEAKRRFPSRPLQIVYAGCGPFAPLAILLTAHFSADEIQFTLLDVHARALQAARRLFDILGLGRFVRRFIKCDAAAYVHDSARSIHILIVETMQRALENEPQVAITLNLAAQLCPDGLLVPQKISVDACLSDFSRELSLSSTGADWFEASQQRLYARRVVLGRVFDLTSESWQELPAHSTSGVQVRDCLRPVTVEIPKDVGETSDVLLQTKVATFGSIVLNEYESGLTCPLFLHDLGKARPEAQIEFRYAPGARPGFEWQWKDRPRLR